ncbi:MAG: SIS domain-containing protein [Elusimicrobiaceae bacterium]|nr:SIS domain-containing protein [Elusimicrobiaceae bacterium]
MQLQNPFFSEVNKLLQKIEQTQAQAMENAAQKVALCLENDGIIHTFGCGHSASITLDAFHRSGCFAAVDAILDPALMFQSGAHTGTALERMPNYANAVMDRHTFQPQDILWVASNSGKNPAGIDAVLYAKKYGVTTIAITAASAHQKSTSRHPSGKMLKDVADIVLDNQCPANETALEINQIQVAPVSTIAGIAIFQAVLFRAAQILAEKGQDLPVYRSSNAGGDEHNTKLAQKYAGRIKHLH